MIIEIRLTGKIRDRRDYEIKWKKDGRFGFQHINIGFNKSKMFGWVVISISLWDNPPREVILKIEAIMRGLNSGLV